MTRDEIEKAAVTGECWDWDENAGKRVPDQIAVAFAVEIANAALEEAAQLFWHPLEGSRAEKIRALKIK